MKTKNIILKLTSLNSTEQGQVIKNARKAKGLNQSQLIKLISQSDDIESIDVKKLSKWETGKINRIEDKYKNAICQSLDLKDHNFFSYSLVLNSGNEYIDKADIQDTIEFLDFVISKVRLQESSSITVTESKKSYTDVERLSHTKNTLREYLYQFIKEREETLCSGKSSTEK